MKAKKKKKRKKNEKQTIKIVSDNTADLNPNISIITFNVNGLNTSSKI